MKLRTISILILIPLIVGLAGCIDPPSARLAPVEGNTYYDSEDLFSIPVPTKWTAQKASRYNQDYGVLTSPDGGITAYVMADAAESAEEGIRSFWKLIDPEFDPTPIDVTEGPPVNGVDKVVRFDYASGDENKGTIGVAWMYDELAYMLILQFDIEAYQKRQSQVNILATGYTISALAPDDLRDAQPLPFNENLIADMEAYIVDVMDRFDVPGLSIAVVQDGEIAYSNGFGVRETGQDEPVTADTLMLIGSTTKTMTTLLMAQMVDEGIVNWDTPVKDILPTFAVANSEISETITVENLVCACTGVPRRDFELLFNGYELSAEDIIESLADFEFFTDFGEAFQYSNQMVATGGYIAALAAGGDYGNLYDDYVTLMEQNIFDPVGMTHTTFSFDEAVGSRNYGIPHGGDALLQYRPLPLETESAFLLPIGPAGGVWSNATDMAEYIKTELNAGVTPNGERIVTTDNLERTWEPQVDIASDASYGLGWMTSHYKGLLVLGHAGNTMGFSSEMAILPEAGLGVIVLTNQQGSIATQMVRMRVLELVFQQEAEFDQLVESQMAAVRASIVELAERIEPNVDSATIEPYLGKYSNDALGQVSVEFDDSKLVFDTGEFQAEIRSIVQDDGTTTYLFFDSAFSSLPVVFRENSDGDPIVRIGTGVNEYFFTKEV